MVTSGDTTVPSTTTFPVVTSDPNIYSLRLIVTGIAVLFVIMVLSCTIVIIISFLKCHISHSISVTSKYSQARKSSIVDTDLQRTEDTYDDQDIRYEVSHTDVSTVNTDIIYSVIRNNIKSAQTSSQSSALRKSKALEEYLEEMYQDEDYEETNEDYKESNEEEENLVNSCT